MFGSKSTAEDVTQGINGSGLDAIVTRAPSGIGTETTRVLALHGVHVVMAIRNTEDGTKIIENIVSETPTTKVDVIELDLGSFAFVRNFAAQYCSSDLPLNIIINNAGVMAPPFTLSKDKIKLQFAMNHIDTAPYKPMDSQSWPTYNILTSEQGSLRVFLPLMKFSKTSYQYYPICFDMKTVEIDIINSIDNDIEDVKGQ
ncbi:NAD(P)-binding Rossmann-fold superfamily protein, partial [Tanacetum coccineum]